MPTPRCPHCPHCRELAERADLRLSPARPRSAPGAVDRGFYRGFAEVYGIARARSSRAVALLCEVNPELTPARCKEYLKRARALGYVTVPGRWEDPPTRAEQPATTGPAEQPDPPAAGRMSDAEAAQWLADARADEAKRKAEEEAADVARLGLNAEWLAEFAGATNTRTGLKPILGIQMGYDPDEWLDKAQRLGVVTWDSRTFEYRIVGRYDDVRAAREARLAKYAQARAAREAQTAEHAEARAAGYDPATMG